MLICHLLFFSSESFNDRMFLEFHEPLNHRIVFKGSIWIGSDSIIKDARIARENLVQLINIHTVKVQSFECVVVVAAASALSVEVVVISFSLSIFLGKETRNEEGRRSERRE